MQKKLEKEYNIYFHHDFDGITSATVIFDFLKKNKCKILNFIPINYDLKNKWETFNFKKNPIIVDFYFHPQAIFWFDHHPTTFIKKSWQKKFKNNFYQNFNPKYKSCCSLIINHLQKKWNYKPSKNIKNLGKWLDIIDGANYKSAKQTIFLKEPALQIETFIDNNKNKNIDWLIKKIPYHSLKQISTLPKIKKIIEKEKKQRKKILEFYYKNLKIFNNKISFIDKTKIKGSLRYAPFYFAPYIIYNIILRKKNKYILSLGVNPWKRNKNKIHVGKFLRKNFGGGGHKTVGGAEFKTKKEALEAVKKIINYLNKK
ncbi:MAG: hypothetical protein N2Z85_02940 [Patescibacteria group bacterium]|nr:hypothetical protein [Patescibacteria group bacterium]